MLTDEQRDQIKDIARLVAPDDERAAYFDMLAHELRGRELPHDELRRLAEQTWRRFLRDGWTMEDGPWGAA